MNVFELNVPIRLYWDLFPFPADCRLDYQEVCREIAGLKILSLTLTDFGPEVSPTCLDILKHLQGKGPAISLAITPEAFDASVLERLGAMGVRTLLVRASSLGELETYRLLFAASASPPVGILFEVTKSNWRELPQLIKFCALSGVNVLSLPMQRLLDGEAAFFLEPEEKHELATVLHQVPFPSGLKVTIHDPFLWKVFFPTVAFPDGGCQAANTMLHITPKGDVYPCPSLPVVLGNVGTIPLKDIVFSAAKKKVRQQILQPPGPCAACCDLASCKGGCRGRACAASGTLDSADPGCRV